MQLAGRTTRRAVQRLTTRHSCHHCLMLHHLFSVFCVSRITTHDMCLFKCGGKQAIYTWWNMALSRVEHQPRKSSTETRSHAPKSGSAWGEECVRRVLLIDFRRFRCDRHVCRFSSYCGSVPKVKTDVHNICWRLFNMLYTTFGASFSAFAASCGFGAVGACFGLLWGA